MALAPKGICCDNCIARERREAIEAALAESRSRRTQITTDSGKRPSAPTVEDEDDEEPKKKARGVVPEKRSKDWLASAHDALESLRLKIKERDYLYSSLSADAILPDYVLSKLASRARLKTIEDIEGEKSPPWLYAKKHGAEALAVLRALDKDRIATREAAKRAKRDDAKHTKAKEKAEHERKEAEARERHLELEREEQARRRQEIENHQREYWNSVTSAHAQAVIRSPPLQGSNMYNLTEGIAMMMPVNPVTGTYQNIMTSESLLVVLTEFNFKHISWDCCLWSHYVAKSNQWI